MYDKIEQENIEERFSGWSHPNGEKIGTLGNVLGRFDGTEDVEKTFQMPTDISSLKIQFDFLEMDSWDDEAFVVWINGREVSLGTFQDHSIDDGDQSGSADGISWSLTNGAAKKIGGNQKWKDQVHNVTITITNLDILESDELTLKFDARTDQRTGDESFAIGNLSIAGVHTHKAISTLDSSDSIAHGSSLTSRETIGSLGTVPSRFDEAQDPEKTFSLPDATEVAIVKSDFSALDTFDIIHQENFEESVSGWSHPHAAQMTQNWDDGNVLGRFDGTEDVEKTFRMPTEVSALKIQFDFLELDNWDDEEFVVWINGREVSLGNYRGHDIDDGDQSGSVDGISWSRTHTNGVPKKIGGKKKWKDQVHEITIEITNLDILESDELTLKFDARTDEAVGDESFAIDNLVIAGQHTHKVIVARDDFDSPAHGWSLTDRSTFSHSNTDLTVLGRFDGNKDPEKTFKLPDTTEIAVVNFDFLEMDKWEDEEFVVWVNGTEVSLGPFWHSAEKNEPSRSGVTDGISWEFTSAEPERLGGRNKPQDEIHSVTMHIPKQHLLGDWLKIKFDSRTDEGFKNESFAIDNFRIEALQSKTIVVASENFENGAYGWSDQSRAHAWPNQEEFHDGLFLGRFDDENNVKKTFDLPGNVTNLRIEFDFLEIDAWGGDRFEIWIDGVAVNFGYFSADITGNPDLNTGNNGSGNNGEGITWQIESGAVGNRGFHGYNDQVHRVTMDISGYLPDGSYRFNGNDVEIQFDTSATSALDDVDLLPATYGIDNFEMTASVDVEPLTDGGWDTGDVDAVVQQHKFEPDTSGDWDSSLTFDHPVFKEVLGRFSGDQDVTFGMTFNNYDLKSGGQISFDFIELGSWDKWQDEEFIVTLNGREFSLGTYASAIDEGVKTGAGDGLSWTSNQHDFTISGNSNTGDEMHKVTINFDPNVLSGHVLNLGFDATLDGSVNNESYAIDNVELRGSSAAFITDSDAQSDFASGHINRGNSLDAGDELLRGEALVSDDYSTALFLNRAGEVKFLHDADGDGDYESSTDLFGAGLDGFHRVGFKKDDGAIYAEKQWGGQYREIVNDNPDEDHVGHRMLLRRNPPDGEEIPGNDDMNAAINIPTILTIEEDGSAITSIKKGRPIIHHRDLASPVYLHLDRFEGDFDGVDGGWANTADETDTTWLNGFRVPVVSEDGYIKSPDDLTQMIRLAGFDKDRPVEFNFELKDLGDSEDVTIYLGDLTNAWDGKEPDKHRLKIYLGTLQEEVFDPYVGSSATGANDQLLEGKIEVEVVKRLDTTDNIYNVRIFVSEPDILPYNGGHSYKTQSSGKIDFDPFMKIHLDMGANDIDDNVHLGRVEVIQKIEKFDMTDTALVGIIKDLQSLSSAPLVYDPDFPSLVNVINIEHSSFEDKLRNVFIGTGSYNLADVELDKLPNTPYQEYFNGINKAIGSMSYHHSGGGSEASLADYNTLLWQSLADYIAHEKIDISTHLIRAGAVIAILSASASLGMALAPIAFSAAATRAGYIALDEATVLAQEEESLADTVGAVPFWKSDGFKEYLALAQSTAGTTTSAIGVSTAFMTRHPDSPAVASATENLNEFDIESLLSGIVASFVASAEASGDSKFMTDAIKLEENYVNLKKSADEYAANVTALSFAYEYLAPASSGGGSAKERLDGEPFATLDEEEGFWLALGLNVERGETEKKISSNGNAEYYETKFTIYDKDDPNKGASLDLHGISSLSYTALHEHYVGWAGLNPDYNATEDFSIILEEA